MPKDTKKIEHKMVESPYFRELDARQMVALENLVKIIKDMQSLRQQQGQHDAARNEISGLIKELKKNKNNHFSKMFGGNLTVSLSNKESLKELMKRKEQVEIALKGINEQMNHREDAIREHYYKVYKTIGHEIDTSIFPPGKEIKE